MIYNRTPKWLAGLGAAALGIALVGCGQNTGGETATTSNATTSTGTTSTGATTETAKDEHAHAPGEAAHSHGEEAPQAASQESPQGAPTELAAFFPGATLNKKAFPLEAADAAHMSEGSGVKFSGEEKEWEVYEASQNGQRIGYAVMTHLSASGGDTHVVFAVDKNFKITKANALDAPKMKPLVEQAVGKNHDAKWKVGQDFKPVAGVSKADAQAAVDALHKGILILDENFNASHGDHAHGDQAHGDQAHGDQAH